MDHGSLSEQRIILSHEDSFFLLQVRQSRATLVPYGAHQYLEEQYSDAHKDYGLPLGYRNAYC